MSRYWPFDDDDDRPVHELLGWDLPGRRKKRRKRIPKC